MNSVAELNLQFTLDTNATADENERFLGRLREELLETSILSVEYLPIGQAPAGSKGVAAEAGALLVTMIESKSILDAIAGVITSVFSNHKKGSVTLRLNGNEITVSNPSAEDQRKLIQGWLSAQKRPPS